MLDRWLHPIIQAPLTLAARGLNGRVTPDQLTFFGFIIGLLAIPLLAMNWYTTALVMILANRILDGLDGTLARQTKSTDAGGFLDITLDFIFYSAVIFGFALANPAANALPAAFLIMCFVGTGYQLSGLCHYGGETPARTPAV